MDDVLEVTSQILGRCVVMAVVVLVLWWAVLAAGLSFGPIPGLRVSPGWMTEGKTFPHRCRG
jgi:hypothetical protein